MLTESAKRALELAESTGACKNSALVIRILEKHGCFTTATQQAVLESAQPSPLPAPEKAAKAKRSAPKGKPWDLARIMATIVKSGLCKAGSKGTMFNVLAHCKIDGKRIQATDYDIIIEVDGPTDLGQGCFAPTALPKGFDGLAFAPDGKSVQAGAARLDTFPIEDFPRIQKDPIDTMTPAGSVDLAALRGLVPCMSDDPARMNLNGVFLDPNGSLVATDGHRMLIASGDTPRPEGRIVHCAWVKAVLAWGREAGLESIPIWYDMGEVVTHIQCDAYAVRIFGRCIDEQYPNYSGVIPVNAPYNVTISGTTVDKIRQLPKAKCEVNRLRCTRGQIALNEQDKSGARVSWSIPESGLDGLPEGLALGFNRRFVEDLPDAESWAVGLIAVDSPSVWRSDKWTAVIMPMDLS